MEPGNEAKLYLDGEQLWYFCQGLCICDEFACDVLVGLQVARERYPERVLEKVFSFKFQQEEVRLDIPKEGIMTKEGWRITALSQPIVS